MPTAEWVLAAQRQLKNVLNARKRKANAAADVRTLAPKNCLWTKSPERGVDGPFGFDQ